MRCREGGVGKCKDKERSRVALWVMSDLQREEEGEGRSLRTRGGAARCPGAPRYLCLVKSFKGDWRLHSRLLVCRGVSQVERQKEKHRFGRLGDGGEGISAGWCLVPRQAIPAESTREEANSLLAFAFIRTRHLHVSPGVFVRRCCHFFLFSELVECATSSTSKSDPACTRLRTCCPLGASESLPCVCVYVEVHLCGRGVR